MMLRRAGLGLLVGAILMAPSVVFAGPALVFEPYNGTVVYAEDADARWFPASLTKLMTAALPSRRSRPARSRPRPRSPAREPLRFKRHRSSAYQSAARYRLMSRSRSLSSSQRTTSPS